MIVHLSFSGKFYGRENAAFSLVRALQEQIEVMMLLVIENRSAAADREDLIRKLCGYAIKHEILYTDKMLSGSTYEDLASALQNVRPSIIHCHCHKSSFYAILLRMLGRTEAKVILTLHGLVLPFSVKAMLHYFMYYFGIALVDGIIGCSRQIVSVISRVPIIKGKVSAIPNGYQNLAKAPLNRDVARAELSDLCGNLAGKVLVANVGRLTLQKNPLFFLRMVKRISDYCLHRDIPIHFILAGDGELRSVVEQSVRDLGIADRLTLTGYVSNMSAIYASVDVLLLTSDWEGTPMCILEAMSYGLPTVAPSVGGIPDVIVDGETGLLFPRRNEEACFAQLVRMIESAELRSSLGKCAFDFYEQKLNYSSWASQHLSYYASIRPEISTTGLDNILTGGAPTRLP